MVPRKTTAPKRQRQSRKAVEVSLNGGESANGMTPVCNGNSPSFEQIQRRAYELFEARGGNHGHDWADWFSAERELTERSVTH